MTENVLSSLKFPSSKTSRNSQPSPSRPWIECGMPDGKFHRSPSPTSSWKARPSSSMAVIRARPLSMKAHSAGLCQCSSRTPPALSRMLTRARSVEEGISRIVVCRDQPPSLILMWLSAKDHLKVGSVPLSVAGGLSLSGLWASRAGFLGPRSVAPSLPRIGSGGLSPVAGGPASACPVPASIAVVAAATAAAPVRKSRRWISDIGPPFSSRSCE